MRKRILVFGDSITYGDCDKEGGWVIRLRKFLDERQLDNYETYNLGIPKDEITKSLLKRFVNETKIRISNNIKRNIIIFAIGINDTEYNNSKKNTRYNLKRFKNNIQKLMKLSRKFSKSVLFVGLTPVDESRVDPIPWFKPYSYKNEYISKYNEIIKSVCNENNVKFIEVFEVFMKLNYKNLLEDGAHPNSEGHKIIFEVVKDYLSKNKII
jgi:lysophospholipase L1-like esterase